MSGVCKVLPKPPSGHQLHVPPIAPHEMTTMTNLSIAANVYHWHPTQVQPTREATWTNGNELDE